MEKNPEIGLCGSWAKSIDINGNELNKVIYKTNDQDIKINLLHECHILHPTIFFRKSLMLKNNLYYDSSIDKNEDYDLFIKMIPITKFHNINKFLLKYRHTSSSEERKPNSEWQKHNDEINNRIFNKLNMHLGKSN